MTFQPLASAGIAKVVRDAMRALQALGGNGSAYSRYIESEFSEYRKRLRDQYRLETRWANSDFWKQNGNYAIRQP
jgi:hypothetical protein